MLQEFLTHLLTPAPLYVKKMGYLRELIAISARYKRCKAHWQSHLNACKGLILKAIELCPGRKQVVVLGSGLLLDIPLSELSQGFEEVLLVDIVHLPFTRRMALQYANVSVLSADVTGVAEAIYKLKGVLPDVWASRSIGLPGCESRPDLVISANILSQLPLCPSSFLANRCHLEEQVINDWAKGLVIDHLVQLSKLSCVVCLITDQRLFFQNAAGVTYAAQDSLHGVVPKEWLSGIKHQDTWLWQMAPLGEFSRDWAVTLEVLGLISSR